VRHGRPSFYRLGRVGGPDGYNYLVCINCSIIKYDIKFLGRAVGGWMAY